MKKILEQIKSKEDRNIEFIDKCLKSNLNFAHSEIEGIEQKYQAMKKLIDSIYNKKEIHLDLSHIDRESDITNFFKFDFEKTNRFLIFYLSKLYEGELKFSTEKAFKKQLKEKIKDLSINIYKTDVFIEPTYQQDNNFVFKINHHLLDNVYFAIVKFSPKGYKFYFFYDVFSDVLVDNLQTVSTRKNLLEKEYFKYKDYYTFEYIKNAIILKAFQNKIINLQPTHKNIEQIFKNTFMRLDRLKSMLIADSNNFDLNEFDKDYKEFLNLINKLEIENNLDEIYNRINQKHKQIKENLLNYQRDKETIEENIKFIEKQNRDEKRLLVKSLNDKIESIEKDIKTISEILNKKIFDYSSISFYQKDIPSISKIGVIEERINDLKNIIDTNKGGILGKIKEKLTSYKQELQLEKEKLRKEKDIVEKSFHNLKLKLENDLTKLKNDNSIDRKLETFDKQLSLEKEKLLNLHNSFSNNNNILYNDFHEIKKNFINLLDNYYTNLDKKYKDFTVNFAKTQQQYSKEYKNYFNNLPNNINYIDFFSKIEKLYNSLSCNNSMLPNELSLFLKRIKKEKKEINKLFDIEQNYNTSLIDKYPKIKIKIDKLLDDNSLAMGIIEAIEDRFVKDLKLIY